MKKVTILFILAAITLISISCGNSGMASPDEAGRKVFSILKTLQDTSKQKYMSHFYTIEELRAYVKRNEDTLSDAIKNDMTEMTKEDYYKRIERDYNQIKEKAIQYGIVWKDIEYMDYTYKTRTRGGISGTEGKLYFKYNNENYKIEVSVFDTGKGHALVEIEDLRSIRKSNY